MVIVAPRSAKLIESHGSRFTLLSGYVFVLLGFLTMLLLWGENIPYWQSGSATRSSGSASGLAGTPASHSLTGSVPVTRVGMASGTADLQRDLGGAIMQSIFGALLAAGYAASVVTQIPPRQRATSRQRRVELTKSFASAARPPRVSAVRDPDHRRRQDGVPGGRPVGVHGGHRRGARRSNARLPLFPEEGDEERLLAEYPAEDSVAA